MRQIERIAQGTVRFARFLNKRHRKGENELKAMQYALSCAGYDMTVERRQGKIIAVRVSDIAGNTEVQLV